MIQKKTIYDVAKEAGVSISTVSRVMNGSANVRESTRKRVEEACVNYRPAAFARELHSKRSRTVGVIINHRPEYFFMNEVYSNALLGISLTAKQASYRLLLDASEDDAEVRNLFYEQRVDGFILMGVRKNSKMLTALLEVDAPFVLVGSYHEDEENVCQVDINNKEAAFQATKYLIGLGHTRIGLMSGSPEYASANDRMAGYEQAMKEAGIPICREFIKNCEKVSEFQIQQLAKNLFYQIPRVTAVVAFNDPIAMAVYKAAENCGISIPEQLSVISFDDTKVAPYMSPPLTSIWQPSYEKGETAMRILLDCLEKGIMPTKRVELNSMIMYRESCSAASIDQ